MLCRDHKEEFEKLTVREELPKSEIKTAEPKKKFSEIEFKLTHGIGEGVELTTRESGWGHAWQVERYMRFCSDRQNDYLSPRVVGKNFCMEILNALIETADPPGDMDLMKDLSQLLEEKFGLRVKVCGNCDRYCFEDCTCHYFCNPRIDNQFESCRHWISKEVSADKKEN